MRKLGVDVLSWSFVNGGMNDNDTFIVFSLQICVADIHDYVLIKAKGLSHFQIEWN